MIKAASKHPTAFPKRAKVRREVGRVRREWKNVKRSGMKGRKGNRKNFEQRGKEKEMNAGLRWLK